jgi:integrase/recombinase XerD
MLPIIPSSRAVTFADLPDVKELLASQLSESSINMYRRDIAAYQSYAKMHGLDTMDAQTLTSWRNELALNSSMSPNTINRMLAAVKRIIKEAASNHLVDESTSLQFKNVDGVKTKALKTRLKLHSRTRISPADMRRLCESPDTTTQVGLRDRALLAAMASSGGRVSEIATLTQEQIVKQDSGYVIQVCGKTDTEYRDAHLSLEAYQLITKWLKVRAIDSQFIFTGFAGRGNRLQETAISETGIWKVVQKYAKQCGLDYISPHDFRRFVGTQLVARTGNIRKAQKALGHKSIEVTARNYVLDTLEAGLTDDLY